MNTSQPISSQLESVSFDFLSSTDIRALSAKRITSATTFDTLLNPVPGGLYTPELGQFGDNACATCGLKTPQCPGHCGHIELPVPVYHPTFMDQVLRLLRASCVFCGRLRMNRVNVNRFSCQLRLVRYGLLKEVKDLDDIRPGSGGAAAAAAGNASSDDDSDDDLIGNADAKDLIAKREAFVKEAIAQAKRDGALGTQKTEASSNVRRAIVAEFMASITKSKKCGNCGGTNNAYRKDRFVKIFRKVLSEKERLANIQSGHKAKDAAVELRKRIRAEQSRKRKRDKDEGVADLSDSSDGNGADDSISEESDGEPEIAGGNAFDVAAGDATVRRTTTEERKEEYLNPGRVHAQLSQLFENERDILSLVYGSAGPSGKKSSKSGPQPSGASADMFFIRDTLVPPNRYRPEARTGNDEIAEAQENSLYKNILNLCDTLSAIQRELKGVDQPNARYRARTYGDFETTWTQLQDAVNSMIDRERNPVQGAAGKRNADGVKQKLEKKEGMFRKYMMGKRVNFAARTVISPDPNIETNEIGVPPVFAVKLTYPEPVTGWNVEELQEAVRNGPFVWPGAVSIEMENGQVINLERKNPEERTALANQLLAPSTATTGIGARGTRPKKVHRHLNNGDIVIMNRQPTLHKPSMMCHRARVLPGEKTLRMHYANCNTYNADFDGDEMNLHFPQNEVARAEALSIADTDHQYLSGTAGKPLRGLIQDHISMGVWLTNKDTLFERAEYMQLLYACLRPENGHCASGRVETVPPAIFKPRPMWTGKQVITSVLKNVTPDTYQGLTMQGKSQTDKNMWGPSGAEEGVVILKDGYLCTGIIDKAQIGPAGGGIVNGVYEAYGHTIAGRLLSVLGRLLTRMLQTRAFSCGIEDLVFTRDGEKRRREALSGVDRIGLEVAAKYVSMENENPKADNKELLRRLEDVLRDDTKQHGLDQLVNGATAQQLTSAVTSACLPGGLSKPFPWNQMQTMTTSGAKGSRVNANQISCNLGQQTLEGRRVPVMVSGKTLPCFRAFETSARAGGYIADRFLTGVRPQEYYFHAMAGREGLIDTAVKTSRSGYLQRCLIKGMEGLRVGYDTSVRDSADGSLIQFLYGEDGLDVCKAKYLNDFKFAAQNYLSLFHNFGMRDKFDTIISEEASTANKQAEKQFRRTGDLGASDPAISNFSPARYAGSTSEKLYRAAKEYVDENPDKLLRDKKKGIEGNGLIKKNFQAILDIRYLKSVVEAGEAVGVMAGQSVGEPSTQMTLNTFHLAGHAAKNVTLGIPRLREIVMTAAQKLSTPTMALYARQGVSIEQAKVFAKSITKLSLAEVLDKVTITESIGKGIAYGEAKKYKIRLDLFPAEEYEKEYAVTAEQVAETIERHFLPRLQAMTRKEIKKRGDEKTLKARSDAFPELGESAGQIEQERAHPSADREGGDDDSDGEGDDDATKDKQKRNEMQAGYEAMEDDEEEELRTRVLREASVESVTEDEAYGGSPRSSPEPGSGDEELEAGLSKRERKASGKEREARIRGEKRTSDVVSFAFDDVKGDSCTFTMEYDSTTAKILMLHLVENAARASLIQSVPGISTCMVDEQGYKEQKDASLGIPLLASGVNISAIWDAGVRFGVLNLNNMRTNSVYDMLLHYGVEAARQTIVFELQAVFGGHGISVDPRHLTLIADYMTRDGVYQAFSRMGYRGNVSPFMKMSFETTVGFLRDALLSGDADDLKNPSARIVVGALSSVGTGGFDVFVPLEPGKGEDNAEGLLGGEEDDDDAVMADAE